MQYNCSKCTGLKTTQYELCHKDLKSRQCLSNDKFNNDYNFTKYKLTIRIFKNQKIIF